MLMFCYYTVGCPVYFPVVVSCPGYLCTWDSVPLLEEKHKALQWKSMSPFCWLVTWGLLFSWAVLLWNCWPFFSAVCISLEVHSCFFIVWINVGSFFYFFLQLLFSWLYPYSYVSTIAHVVQWSAATYKHCWGGCKGQRGSQSLFMCEKRGNGSKTRICAACAIWCLEHQHAHL